MQKSYRNPKHFMENESKGENRRTLTEEYYLQKISEWLQYIFYGLVACVLLGIGVLIRIIAG